MSQAPLLTEEYDPFHDPEADELVKASLGKFPASGHKRFSPKTVDIAHELLHGKTPEQTGVDPKQSRKQKASQAAYCARKTKEIFEAQGWFYAKTEYWAVSGQGMAYKQDLIGCFDALAIKNGVALGIQITTVKDFANHKREMLDPSRTKQYCGNPRANLLKWIASGAQAVFVLWEQVNGKWEHQVVEIDHAMIADVDSRRRK